MVDLIDVSKQELYETLKRLVDARREAQKSQDVITKVMLGSVFDDAEFLVDQIEGEAGEAS